MEVFEFFKQQFGKKDTFCHWEWGPILLPNEAKKEHCIQCAIMSLYVLFQESRMECSIAELFCSNYCSILCSVPLPFRVLVMGRCTLV